MTTPTGARKPPRTAVVLAAGFGSRMQPLSVDRPKAVMPFWNHSLLQRALERLYQWGVRHFLVNVHSGADEVVREVVALGRAGWPVTLSFEPTILGTGGALTRARWFLDDAPFWVVNADVVLDGSPTGLIQTLQKPDTIAALWMYAARGPRSVLCSDGYVQNFRAPQPGAPGTATFCGVHLIRPELWNFMPDNDRFVSIIDVYEQALTSGWRIAAYQAPDTRWADVGTPEQYLDAHAEWAPDASENMNFVCVSPKARVASRARIRNSVIWEGATIGSAAVVDRAIVGRGAQVNSRVTGVVVKASHALTQSEQAALRAIGWSLGTTSVNPLPPRGSDRTFLRLLAGRRRGILVRYEITRRENAFYASQARFLRKQGWPVPEVWYDFPAEQWALFHDLGDDSLLGRMTPQPKRSAKAYYVQVIDEITRLHDTLSQQARRARLPLMPPFDAETYRYERHLFIDHYVHAQLGWSPKRRTALNRELSRVGARLSTLRPVLIHRDLQSSNILLYRNQVHFIDFQGMRFGPAAYDLASLLCDPYVNLPLAWQAMLLERYQQQVSSKIFTLESYRWACVQRLVQVVGALSRLAALPGCERFSHHLPVALERLLHAARACEGLPLLQDACGACSKNKHVALGQ